MGSVIYLHERNKKIITELEDITSDDVFEKQRLESIRDGVESMLSLISGIRKDPEAVALSSARFSTSLAIASSLEEASIKLTEPRSR